MTILQSIILGIIQGLTEFIPVSSTAHLLIGQKLLGIISSEVMFSYLVIVQLGTILSLMIIFGRDLLILVKAFFAKPFSTPENRLVWYIIIATVPALIAGYLLKSEIERLFKNPLLEAAIRLIISAIILFLAEWLGKRQRNIEKMTWLDALVIGFAQVIAVFPGASRSGTTISAGLIRGLDRPSAARFAFLLSIPVMIAAGGYQALDLFKIPVLTNFLPVLAIGFVIAAIVGWIAVRWLMRYLSKHSLFIFAGYCVVMGIICLFFA